MHLTLSPQRGLPGQPEMTIHVAGDVITLDGVAYDLSPVPEGGEGEWPGSPLVGTFRRAGGVIRATIIVRLGDHAADVQPTDPEHWVIADAAGVIAIPALRKPAEPQEPDA